MYVIIHFGSVLLNIVRWALRLRPRFMAAWAWDGLVWVRDLVDHAIRSRRRVRCECCGWEGNRFFLHTLVTGNRVHRAREMCPRCRSLERQRQLVRYLDDTMQRRSLRDLRVLAVGESKAVMRWAEARACPISTVDITPGLAGIMMDITRCGFRDDAFDLVLCSHVLEHIPDDRAAMSEMLRVTKAGGTCIVQVPLQAGLAETMEYASPNADEFDHVRAYGQDFPSRLRSTGWNVSHEEDGLYVLGKGVRSTNSPEAADGSLR